MIYRETGQYKLEKVVYLRMANVWFEIVTDKQSKLSFHSLEL